MYELGIHLHVTGLCTIQIGEVGRLPLDISTIQTIQFKRSPAGLVAARNKLVTAIGHSLAHGCPPTTAGRVLRLRPTRLDGATFDAQAQAESVVVSRRDPRTTMRWESSRRQSRLKRVVLISRDG